MTTDLIEQVLVGPLGLPGIVDMPHDARALVLFVHGSGSSRRSARNQHVARVFHRHGLGTLLFDLLRQDEEPDRTNVFDIALLAQRVVDALEWVARRNDLAALPIGLFGASTGAAAALVAAAARPGRVAAVVSRGGRPDLAAGHLPDVAAPTLLIVGGADPAVLAANRAAFSLLRCPKRLEVVPAATHLFEEPGALDGVGEMAADWFADHAVASRHC